MDAQQISSLSDDELYAKLQEAGGIVGPIVASTRRVYERQLFRLLNGISICESSHESGGEEEPEEPKSSVSSQVVYGSKVEFRHRPIKSYAQVHDGIYFDRTSLARSSYRSDLQNSPDVTGFRGARKEKYSTSSSQQPKKVSVVLVVGIALIVILVVLVYFNMEGSSKNPVPLPP